MNYLKITDNENLMRDPETGVVLNFDNAERAAIIRKRAAALSAAKEIERQNQEINNIKNDLTEIKNMLMSLIQGNL